MRYRGRRSCRNGGWQGRGKDESRRIGPHRIGHLGRGRDVAAQHTERLAQRTVDDVDAAHQPVTLGHAAAARAVHADGVHLVEIGERAEFVRQIADRADGPEIAVHRIDALEGDELWRRGIVGFEQFAQVIDIVVPENPLRPAVAAHALDHACVVQAVGIDDQAGEQLGQGRKRRVVCDVGRGEEQCRLLAVQIGQFRLELLVVDRGAGNVACATGPRAHGIERLVHGRQDCRMLPHPEIVVATPHGHRHLRPVRPAPACVREMAVAAGDIDECPVAPLVVQPRNREIERCVEVHGMGYAIGHGAASCRLVTSHRAVSTFFGGSL